jgi:DNA helicase II / ATP-dependent DNA helicase PcrA
MNASDLEQLNAPQREAVETTEGPLLVLAGAGSGKTRVITMRIAHLLEKGVAPWHILAVTFTNKAAEEMQKRINLLSPGRGSGVVVSTYHRFCSQLLRREGEAVGLSKHYVIYDEHDQKDLIKECLTELNLDEKKFKPGVLLGLISRSKDELIDAQSYQIHALASDDPFRHMVASVYVLYQKKLHASNAVDFGDLILKSAELFRDHAAIREKYQERFRYMLVDEYQDTNRAQYVLTKALAAKHRNLCVVGDDDQCLPGDTLIQTPDGLRRIDSLEIGDHVLAAAGRGRTLSAKIQKVHKRSYEGVLYKIRTRKGFTLRATPEHMVFARLGLLEGRFYVYLMHRRDRGYRIGIAKSTRSPRQDEWRTGLAQRGNQERADKMWVLRVCRTRSEAQYYEALYAFQYGIPTAVFDTCGRKMQLTEQQISQLYSQIDTHERASKLMKDLRISPHYPHHRPKGISGSKAKDRQTVHFRMFGDGRFSQRSPWGMHRIALNTTDTTLRDLLKSKDLHTRPGRRNTWRIEASRLSYQQGFALAEEISREAGQLDIQFSSFLLKEGVRHDFHPVSHLREGMWVPIFDKGAIVDDEIESVQIEKFSGEVYDLDVEHVHNYIANRWAVHNCVYVWRGADIRNILDFEKEYPEAKVIKLEQNYRSTERILDVAWKVVHHNKFRKDKKLWTAKTGGDPVTADEFADERQEAMVVASTIKQGTKQSDMRYGDYAVFYRINAQSRVLEDALRRLEIPYKIVGSVRFYDRAEVKDILAYLRLVINPVDTLALRRIINSPSRGLGKTSLEQIEHFAGQQQISLFDALARAQEITTLKGRAANAAIEFHTLISTLIGSRDIWTSHEMIRQVLDSTGYLKVLEQDEDGEAQTRAQNVRELVNAVEEYEERSPDKSTAGFLEQVSLVADSDEIESGTNYVTLMTVHLAKGLEFPFVFLTGMEQGLFPIGESDFSQEELEEERRLCYVGMTRAKKNLYITWAATRRLFGHSRWNAPSQFIQEAGLVPSTPPATPVDKSSSHTGEVREPVMESSYESSYDPVDPDVTPMYTVGMRVRHAEFGQGKIIEKTGIGDSLKVVVLFDSGQWKKLLVKYANLERL